MPFMPFEGPDSKSLTISSSVEYVGYFLVAAWRSICCQEFTDFSETGEQLLELSSIPRFLTVATDESVNGPPSNSHRTDESVNGPPIQQP